ALRFCESEVDRMRLTRTILGFAVAACFALTPAYADHRHASAPKPTTGAGKPNTTANQTTSSTPQTTNVSKPHSKPSAQHASSTKSSAKSSSKSTTTTGGAGTSTHLNPIAAKISSKPHLNAKITAMLPMGANGKPMSLNEA